MANLPGPQPEVRYCPCCKANLRNVPRNEMKSKGYTRRDGTVAEHTHTYECDKCNRRFEINQNRKTIVPSSSPATGTPRQSAIGMPIKRNDHVLHRANGVDVYRVLLVIRNQIPGGPSLCKCVRTTDEDSRFYNFLSSELLLTSKREDKTGKDNDLGDYASAARKCRFRIGDFAKHKSQAGTKSAPILRILDILVPVRASEPCMCVCECPARFDDRELRNYPDVELVPVQKFKDDIGIEDFLGTGAEFGVDGDAQIDEAPPASRPRTFAEATELLLREPR